MTIAVAYLTSDGLVLGADSTTTISDGAGGKTLQFLNHSQKVFEVGEVGDSRMGLCMCGDGSIGNKSHRTIVARLADGIGRTTSVRDVADRLAKTVRTEIRSRPARGISLLLGGWNYGARTAECYRLVFKGRDLVSDRPLSVGQAVFDGVGHFAERIVRGCDQRFLAEFLRAIVAEGKPLPADFEATFFAAAEKVMDKEQKFARGYQDLPIREAIDFVHTHLLVTVKGLKFRYEMPICGGPIEIGFISADRPFRWVRHKDFQTAILESQGGGQ